MALKSKPRSFRRLLPLAIALLLAALVAIPASNLALAQSPPGDAIALVNEDRNLVERKKGGEFVARPVFDREIETLSTRSATMGATWLSSLRTHCSREDGCSTGRQPSRDVQLTWRANWVM